MLQGLEAPDRATELHPVLGVGDGEVQASRRGADLLDGQQDRSSVGQPGVGTHRRGGLGVDHSQPSRRVHGNRWGCGELRPPGQRLTVGRDDDVGDVAVNHIARIKHRRPDRGPLGESSQGLTVGVVDRQQRELSQGGAPQRGRHQSLAQLLEHHGGISQFAARAAQLFGNHQRRGAHLLAQHRPQRLVVTALGGHRLANGVRSGVLLHERSDGVA